MKKNKITFGLAMMLLMGLAVLHPVWAETGTDSKKEGVKPLSDIFTLSGAIELDYSYSNDKDVSDNTQKESSSRLDIGTIELGLEANLHEHVTANLLILGENLDSDPTIVWDEAFFTLANKDFPFYFVGGKRVQPFGLFESLFINDPITQDLYEINKTGATLGVIMDQLAGLDLGVTLYKGETLIQRVNDSGFGWERDVSAGYMPDDDVSSLIVHASCSPKQDMDLAVYYNSEPGDSGRNATWGSSFHWEISNFITDAEYISALTREKHVGDDQEHLESAWFVSLGYRIMDPLVLAIRYEDFREDKTQDGHLDLRYGVGAAYTLFETPDFVCTLLGEYRKSQYETSANTLVDSKVDEVFARIALEF